MSTLKRVAPLGGLALDTVLSTAPSPYSTIFKAVLADCRTYYPSRALFDKDYKVFARWTLQDAYSAWKHMNMCLATGSPVSVPDIAFRPQLPAEVRALRQVAGLFTRLEGICDSDSSIKAWASRVRNVHNNVPATTLSLAKRYLKNLLGRAPMLEELVPRHGPGAVATGEKGWEKWAFKTLYSQLNSLVVPDGTPYPAAKLVYLNQRHREAVCWQLTIERHPTTKVVAVPKDITKPRIISEEPLLLQYLQQGVMRWLYDRIEQRTPEIRFRDQSVNARLCLEWEDLATLDLSDASDLVSRRLVWNLFPADWRRLLFGLRSHFARLPNGDLIPLRCFAPMGSALCFPVEALVFWSLISAFLHERFLGSHAISVYGDDIIVPRRYAEDVMGFLSSIGMKPNVAKCCFAGSFRESCGAEYLGGVDITVVRPKSICVTRLTRERDSEVPALLPMVAAANRANAAGFKRLAQSFADLVTLPVALGTAPWCATRELRWKCVGHIRFNPVYQRTEQLCALPSAKRVTSGGPREWEALQAYLISGWRSSYRLNGSLTLRYKWMPESL